MNAVHTTIEPELSLSLGYITNEPPNPGPLSSQLYRRVNMIHGASTQPKHHDMHNNQSPVSIHVSITEAQWLQDTQHTATQHLYICHDREDAFHIGK